MRALPFLAALVGLPACEEPTPRPPITWSGSHLDYGEFGGQVGEVPRLCGSRSLDVDVRLTLDCSDDVTIGSDASELESASEGPQEMWQWVAFDVVEASYYSLQQAESPAVGRIELMRCDIGCPGVYQELPVPAVSVAEGGWLDLEPGRYVARFVRRVDAPGWMSVIFG